MAALDGLRILVPESRELDLFAAMLEEEGATALRCPLVRICDLEDPAVARAWILQLIAGTFQDAIWLTGEGLRRLVAIARAEGCEEAFVKALGAIRSITRGPKPARALRELGLAPKIAATVPTSEGVRAALTDETLAGRRIGVQLYPGDGGLPLIAWLRQRGAEVFPVTPYRYANEAETDRVAEAVRALIAGRIDIVAFTASLQVVRLFQVAEGAGCLAQLRASFDRTTAAAIGPVVEESLRAHGVERIVRPETSFHLKPLVRAIAAARSR